MSLVDSGSNVIVSSSSIGYWSVQMWECVCRWLTLEAYRTKSSIGITNDKVAVSAEDDVKHGSIHTKRSVQWKWHVLCEHRTSEQHHHRTSEHQWEVACFV